MVVICISATLYLGQPQTGGGAGGSLAVAEARNKSNIPQDKEITVSVNQQSNPLLDAARQVAEQLEIGVSFEEPEWLADGDLMRYVDTTEAQARPPEVRARLDPNVKIQGAGTIQSHGLLRAGQDRFELAGQLLQNCLDDHARRGNPGRFKLVRLDNYGYSIVPTEVRGKSGEWVSAPSPLDTRISFPRAKRNLRPTLELISQAISKSSGEKIEPDIYRLPGINDIYSVAVTSSGAGNEVAREVLARALREMTVELGSSLLMSWHLESRLDHDRNPDAPAYVLRFTSFIHTNPDGTRESVYWPDPTKTK
jgi:hypothetical protein